MGIFLKKELWMKYQKRLFALFFLISFILIVLYVYFINLAVLKTAERNNCLNELTQVKREFQSLEIAYINTLNELSLSYARSLGFVEAEPTVFIHRQKVVARNINYDQVLR